MIFNKYITLLKQWSGANSAPSRFFWRKDGHEDGFILKPIKTKNNSFINNIMITFTYNRQTNSLVICQLFRKMQYLALALQVQQEYRFWVLTHHTCDQSLVIEAEVLKTMDSFYRHLDTLLVSFVFSKLFIWLNLSSPVVAHLNTESHSVFDEGDSLDFWKMQ